MAGVFRGAGPDEIILDAPDGGQLVVRDGGNFIGLSFVITTAYGYDVGYMTLGPARKLLLEWLRQRDPDKA